MKKSILIAMVTLFTYNAANAGNVPPVPVLTSTPNQSWFYNLEDVVFSSSSSYDTDGYVNYSKFYINGVLKKSISYMGSYSTCFALYGSPAGDCYVLANGVTTVSVKLEVRDNSGEWSSTTTVYTIQEHKGRKYFLTDHLGNVRTTVNRDGNVLGYDDYYAFGLSMPGSHSSNTSNPNDNYKFTGHERDDEAGLTIDYMNARTYDPVIGRFMQVDPMVDQFPGWTPYHYVHNNPLKLTDPTGMMACDEDGKDCSLLDQIKSAIGMKVQEHELPIEAVAVVGLNEIVKQDAIEGIDETVPMLEKVGDGADIAELGLATAAIPTGGATGPLAAIAGAVGTTADLLAGVLMIAKEGMTGESNTDGEAKIFGAVTGAVVGAGLDSYGKAIVKETSSMVNGPLFRSGVTGRFISNYQGASIRFGAPTAGSVAASTAVALYNTIFE